MTAQPVSQPIRTGVVGATVTPGGSGWGANTHVPALQALPRYELTAVCTAHEDTAKASADAFGAKLAFHDVAEMVARPEIDLVVVCVRVPWHYEPVMSSLSAGKATFCEWPLATGLSQADELTALARQQAVPTFIGLQARSDPVVRYARELVAQGFVGEVLTANLSVINQARTERGPGRIWQGIRSNGANPLTIPGGHGIDALCAIVGELGEVSARIATRIGEWRHADTGEAMAVDAPDVISVAGQVRASGAEVAIQVATVPHHPSGHRLEIYGSDGTLVITATSTNLGPNTLYGARGEDPLEELTVPARFTLVQGVPAGPARNVALAYERIADALGGGEPFEPDFELALRRHALLDAIEMSAEGGRSITV